MKKFIVIILAAWILMPLLAQHCGYCAKGLEAKSATVSQTDAKQVIPAAKKAHWIDKDHYVTYEWNKSPKIGSFLLLVNVFDKNKNRITHLNLTANAYMPSMKGSHDTGDKPMKLNKKNQYAIPVYFMMLGDWEIELKFNKDKRQIGNAFVQLDIK
ncbi:MAG: FixH family protein [Candidatus Cloacimonadaceae bacterium]|nr:FixH family protein [Candidatus Cloacimonadaceae bacterium]